MRAIRLSLFIALTVQLVPGGAPQALATFPGANGEITFLKYDSHGILSMRTVHPDGSKGRVLTRSITDFDDAEWSPDGRSYLLSVFDRNPRIMVVDADSKQRSLVIRVDDVPGGYGVFDSVAYSPTGDAVVFCAFREEGPTLFTVGIDGSDLALVSERNDCYADWSVTDLIVAVHGNRRIVTMDPDGGNRQVVADASSWQGDGLSIAPSWSPDGSRIVFSTATGRHRHDLFLVNGDGSGLLQLTDTARRSEYAPVFSPDGTRVAYTRSRRAPFRGTIDLFLRGVDGSNRQRLTDTPKRREFTRSWQAQP